MSTSYYDNNTANTTNWIWLLTIYLVTMEFSYILHSGILRPSREKRKQNLKQQEQIILQPPTFLFYKLEY